MTDRSASPSDASGGSDEPATQTSPDDTAMSPPTDDAVSSSPPDDPVAIADTHPVLLFDGVCNLCNRSIQFVIENDPDAQFRFAPLQSAVAQELLAEAGYEGETLDSVVLVEGDTYYEKSDAAIRTARHLGGIYRVLGPFGLLPTRLRNLVYDFIAARRYRWFGRRDQCMMPSPELKERFLAGGPGN